MKNGLITVIVIFALGLSAIAQRQKLVDSLLFEAVFSQNLDSVRLLLKQGANPNAKNIFGITPLLYAAEMGNAELTELLIKAGADVNYKPPYDPPALCAVIIHNRSDTVLELLLRSGANPNIIDNLGYTPLAYAIYNGNYSAADLLLYYGADPNLRFNSWSPLDLACYFDDTTLVNMLLYYGADVNATDSLGFTSLHICAQENSANSASILLSHKAKTNIPNIDNVIPLTMAIYTRSHRTFDTLLRYPQDLDIKVLNKFYPTTFAILTQNYKAFRALKKQKKHHFQPIFNFMLGFYSQLNYQDIFAGMHFGLKELVSNIDFYLAMTGRLTPCRTIFQIDSANYLQLWEKRMFLTSALVKNFYIVNIKKSNLYLRLGAKLIYTHASYRGSLMSNNNLWVRPNFGIGFDVNNLLFGFDLDYYKLQGLNTVPIYLNFSITLRISPYQIVLKQKHFYLQNVPLL